jgi:hypothetical protein
MRLIPRVFILAAIFLLFISYQNFSSVNSKDWDSASSLKIINEMNAFESSDKQAEALATPQNGDDLQSIGNDWMQRQGSIILNGFDKKIEYAMNEKLNSWAHEITRKDPPEEPIADGSTEVKSSKESLTRSQATDSQKIKQNLRFSRINSLKYDLGEKTCMDLTADPGNTRFNLSQSLTSRAKVGVEHRTADNQTKMFLKYEW